jgi:hypothetical protein
MPPPQTAREYLDWATEGSEGKILGPVPVPKNGGPTPSTLTAKEYLEWATEKPQPGIFERAGKAIGDILAPTPEAPPTPPPVPITVPDVLRGTKPSPEFPQTTEDVIQASGGMPEPLVPTQTPPTTVMDTLRRAREQLAPTPPAMPKISPEVKPLTQKTTLSPEDERAFQKWYAETEVAKYHMNPDPDAPQHYYDLRGAWKAGARREYDPAGHLPDQWKMEGHPTQGTPDWPGSPPHTGATVPLQTFQTTQAQPTAEEVAAANLLKATLPTSIAVHIPTPLPSPVKRPARIPELRPAPPIEPPTLASRLFGILRVGEGQITPRNIAKAQIELEARIPEARVAGLQPPGQPSIALTKEAYIDLVNPNERGVREMQRLGDAVFGGAVGTVGSTAKALEYFTGSKELQDLARGLADVRASLTTEDPNIPQMLADGVGSTLSFFIPGLAIGKGAAAVAAVSPRLATWLAVSSASVLEAMAEAGGVYDEALKSGMTKEEAEKAANKTFWANPPVILATNKLGLFAAPNSPMVKGLSRALKSIGAPASPSNKMARIILPALMEGIQEASQEIVSSSALGKQPTAEQLGMAALVGFVAAGGISAVRQEVRGLQARELRAGRIPAVAMPQAEGALAPPAVPPVAAPAAKKPPIPTLESVLAMSRTDITDAESLRQAQATMEAGTTILAQLRTTEGREGSLRQREWMDALSQLDDAIARGREHQVEVTRAAQQRELAGEVPGGGPTATVAPTTAPPTPEAIPMPPAPGTAKEGAVVPQPGVVPAARAEVAPSGPPPDLPTDQLGSEATSWTARKTPVQYRWAVVEADQPISSHDAQGHADPRYLADLQQRERGRISSVEQIQGIATSLMPQWLGESASAAEGAPWIGPDWNVEGGNARIAAIRSAYRNRMPTAQTYREWLLENAEKFGLSRGVVEKIQSPVLVRVRTTATPTTAERIRLTREMNESGTARMSATEEALTDVERLTPQILDTFVPSESGEIDTKENAEFIRGYIQGVVPEAARGGMRTPDGRLSLDGEKRIRAALIAKAFGDRDLVTRIVEDPDDNVRNISKALAQAMPNFLRLRADVEAGAAYNRDLIPELLQATRKLSALRQLGMPVADYLRQAQMFQDIQPMSAELLAFLNDNARSPNRIRSLLDIYTNAVRTLGDPRQTGMLGDRPPEKIEVLRAALNEWSDVHGLSVPVPQVQPRAGAAVGQPPPGVPTEVRPEPSAGPTGFRSAERRPGPTAVEGPPAAPVENVLSRMRRARQVPAPPQQPGMFSTRETTPAVTPTKISPEKAQREDLGPLFRPAEGEEQPELPFSDSRINIPESQNLVDRMRVERGGETRASAAMDPRLLQVLGGNLYSGDLGIVALKEMLQNAVDSLRALPDKSQGKINVTVDTVAGSIAVSDNGIGMTPEVATRELVDIGGSYKPGEESSGGFGIAKVAIFANSSAIEIETAARDPRTGRVTVTNLSGSGEDWIDPSKGLRVESREWPAGSQTGTTLRVKLGKPVHDYSIRDWLRTFLDVHMLPFGISAKVNGEVVQGAKGLGNLSLDKVGSFKSEGATVDVYASRQTKRRGNLQYTVLNNGLPQFDQAYYPARPLDLPETVVVNVKAISGPETENYPFRPDRQGLRGNIGPLIDTFMRKELVNASAAREMATLVRVLKEAPHIKGTRFVAVDTSGNLPVETVKAIAEAPITQELMRLIDWTYAKLAATVKRYPGEVSYRGMELRGIGLGADYLGLHIKGVVLYGAGANNLVLINPFTMAEDVQSLVDHGIITTAEAPAEFGRRMTAMILHEISHQAGPDDSEAFSAALTSNQAATLEELFKASRTIADALGGFDGLQYRRVKEQLYTLRQAWGTGQKENLFRQISSSHATRREPVGGEGRPARSPEGGAGTEGVVRREPSGQVSEVAAGPVVGRGEPGSVVPGERISPGPMAPDAVLRSVIGYEARQTVGEPRSEMDYESWEDRVRSKAKELYDEVERRQTKRGTLLWDYAERELRRRRNLGLPSTVKEARETLDKTRGTSQISGRGTTEGTRQAEEVPISTGGPEAGTPTGTYLPTPGQVEPLATQEASPKYPFRFIGPTATPPTAAKPKAGVRPAAGPEAAKVAGGGVGKPEEDVTLGAGLGGIQGIFRHRRIPRGGIHASPNPRVAAVLSGRQRAGLLGRLSLTLKDMGETLGEEFVFGWVLRKFPHHRNDFRLIKDAASDARILAGNDMVAVIGDLNEADYQDFRMLWILRDLQETAQEGKTLPAPSIDQPPLELPEVQAEIARLEALASQRVMDALAREDTQNQEHAQTLITRGLLDPDRVKQHYAPHHVLDYTDGIQIPGLPRRLQKQWRGYTMERKGSPRAIDVDYFRVKWTHLVKYHLDNILDDFVWAKLREADETETIREAMLGRLQDMDHPQAEELAKRWKPTPGERQQVGTQVYEGYQFERGRQFYPVTTIPEDLADYLVSQSVDEGGRVGGVLLDPPKGRPQTTIDETARTKPTIGRHKKVYMIPVELASVLKQFRQPIFSSLVSGVLRTGMGLWKRTVLGFAGLPFQYSNFLGDLINLYKEDPAVGGPPLIANVAGILFGTFGGGALFGGAGAIVGGGVGGVVGAGASLLSSRHMRRGAAAAFKKAFRKQMNDPQVQAWLDEAKEQRVVGGSTFYGAEVESLIQQHPELRRFLPLTSAIWQSRLNPVNVLDIISQAREESGRLAKFFADMERIGRGESVVVSGIDLRGLTPVEGAGKAAREFTVDYGATTPLYQKAIRGFLFPFATFYHGNFSGWANAFRRKPIKLSLLVLVPLFATWIWNNTLGKEQEEGLPLWYRFLPHINTMYKTEDGQDIIVALQTPLDMAAKMIGLDAMPWLAGQVYRGEKTVSAAGKELLVHMGQAPVEAHVALLTPLIKTLAELIYNREIRSLEKGRPIVPKGFEGSEEAFYMRLRHGLGQFFAPYAQYIRADRSDKLAEIENPFIRTLLLGFADVPRASGIRYYDPEKQRRGEGFARREDLLGDYADALEQGNYDRIQEISGQLRELGVGFTKGQLRDTIRQRQTWRQRSEQRRRELGRSP